MKKHLMIWTILLLSLVVNSFGLVNVTGTVQDAQGNVATSGSVTFTIYPNSGSTLYYVSGTTVIAPTNTSCTISGSGTINCSLYGNDVISPANTCYSMLLAPNGGQTTSVKVLLTGTAFNINTPTFCPTVSVSPQNPNYSTFPYGTNVVPAFAHALTVGTATLPYAAGYFDNLFVSNLTVVSAVSKVVLLSQGGNIGSTTLYTVPSNAISTNFRINAYEIISRAATTSSSLPPISIIYTDADTSVVNTVSLNTGGSLVGTSNILGSYVVPPAFMLSVKPGTTINYSTSGYASSGGTSMQYNLRLLLEQL